MKLYYLSWWLSLTSYVVLGVFRRSSPLVEGMSAGMQTLAIVLLSILPAGVGIVLGVLSWQRREVKGWWAISVIVVNVVMGLAAIAYLT